ncbi:MAG: hypothetical protein ACYDH5_10520 [Acidimicrobiales bacterium]
MSVRGLEADGAEWAAKLMEQRRQIYASYSPVFWRPAAGVTGLHAGFIRRLAAKPSNVCLRAEHGFVIGQLRGAECFVDDFALDEEGTWADDGAELLDELWARAASDTVTTMRVVTARADRDKVAMLTAAGLALAEQWWVKPLDPTAASETAAGRVAGPGFSGLLGPAPPVYDPGGPVLLVDRLEHDCDLASVEDQAAAMGAVLAIIPVAIGDDRDHDLAQRDWTVASQWYLGLPEPIR